MSDHFIPLKCENCGAKLEVYDDMTRFTCGFCRSEMLVQRRGGTVALKGVEESIQRVQIGTDRTAAELALVRLQKELDQLEIEADKVHHYLGEVQTKLETEQIRNGNRALGWAITMFSLLLIVSVGIGWCSWGELGIVVFLVLGCLCYGVASGAGLWRAIHLGNSVERWRNNRSEAETHSAI